MKQYKKRKRKRNQIDATQFLAVVTTVHLVHVINRTYVCVHIYYMHSIDQNVLSIAYQAGTNWPLTYNSATVLKVHTVM